MTIDDAIKNKVIGLYYGNRIILPFKAELLKVIIEDDIITDFSSSSSGIQIVEHDDFMDLYFFDYKDLKDSISEYENIKLVLVEKGKSVFDLKNHRKIALYLSGRHKVTIEESDADILFIE